MRPVIAALVLILSVPVAMADEGILIDPTPVDPNAEGSVTVPLVMSQPACTSKGKEQVDAGLRKSYTEESIGNGLSRNGYVVRVYASPKNEKTFTITHERPNGIVCLVGAGNGFIDSEDIVWDDKLSTAPTYVGLLKDNAHFFLLFVNEDSSFRIEIMNRFGNRYTIDKGEAWEGDFKRVGFQT